MITLSHDGSSKIEIRQSEFIGHCMRVNSADEACAAVKRERALYPDARHCCHAWIIDGQIRMSKSSDDGEPSGTAGMPLLSLLEVNNISNAVVCVTRYFGGILLGKGGLVRAYTEAGRLALGDAQPFRSVPGACYEVKVDYSEFDRITRQIREKGWTVESSVFDSGVAINVLVPDSDCQVFKDFCRDATSGRAIVGKLGIREIEGDKLNLF